jgi:serine/threonine protein kinase/beta-lactam-binding protein with PASTA domain
VQPDESAPDPARLSGRLVDGRYRIGARIARGGMASVHEAVDVRLDRTVAIKVMHPGLGDDDEFAARFVREARHAARLSHPNVVAVYDQGDDHGLVFLVMEYVPGHTLRDVVRKEAPLAPERALELVEPLLSALATAHRHHLVHRDVKPENVLIAEGPGPVGGRVKVADFGLAKAVSADTQHTATGGVLIGTVSYLAPELVVDGRADARADVYAVGVLLHELLTGHKPHEGDSPIQVAWKHVHEDVPAPSASVPGIPPYVDALVARATARDRELRPADASVMLHQLHRVSQALREGVTDDPELTADLLPHGAPAEEDTTPEPFDRDAFDPVALVSASAAAEAVDRVRAEPAASVPPTREHTSALDVAPAGPPAPPRTPAVRPGAVPARRRSRRGPVLLVLALVLAVGTGVGAWWYGWERWTITPGVLRMTEAEATDRLARDGLDAELGDAEFSETVPRGEVVSSSPEPGDRVLDGGTVTLVLSRGKERYDVPRLRGSTEDEAQDALADTSLSFGSSREVWHEKVPDGEVVRTDPAAGTTLRPGSPVDLVVSKGRRPIPVGDWVGRRAALAERRLEDRGLEATVSGREFSDSVPRGRVVRQSPSSGRLYRGDAVSLVVSRGPELVEVPDGLVASGVDAATERLEEEGFEVEVREDDSYIGLGFVFRTDPGSGELVPRGSTVTLYLI